jgi:hypothetical protein
MAWEPSDIPCIPDVGSLTGRTFNCAIPSTYSHSVPQDTGGQSLAGMDRMDNDGIAGLPPVTRRRTARPDPI